MRWVSERDPGDAAASGLWDVLTRRRSHRRYAPEPASDADVAYVLDCARRFCERCGFEAPRIDVIPRGEGFDEVVRAAASGVLGLVNPWLRRTDASHLMLCAVAYPADRRGRERAIEQAAMTMEVAVLAAAERGLATCWMAGINHGRVESVHRLPDGATLIAMSRSHHPGDHRHHRQDAGNADQDPVDCAHPVAPDGRVSDVAAVAAGVHGLGELLGVNERHDDHRDQQRQHGAGALWQAPARNPTAAGELSRRMRETSRNMIGRKRRAMLNIITASWVGKPNRRSGCSSCSIPSASCTGGVVRTSSASASTTPRAGM